MRGRGIIHGKQILLDHELGLPAGSLVTVTIEPEHLTLDEQRKIIDSLCGSGRDDPTIMSIFEEIQRDRESSAPRPTSFDATS